MDSSHQEEEKSIDSEIEEIEQNTSDKKKRLMPRKADFRMRAHINPLNDTPFPCPLNPDYADWKLHFPLFYGGTEEDNQKLYLNTPTYPIEYPKRVDDKYNGRVGPQVEFADVGCGFGGLTIVLGERFPDKLTMGLEIRDKVVNYVGERIRALRISNPGKYGNISGIRTNAMRHMCNYFRKGQLTKMFFCFADPHFKRSNFRRRIINTGLVVEYAYLLKKGGRLYSITDVEDLHIWNLEKMDANKLFRKVDEKEFADDICVDLIMNETEEGKKVTKNGGKKFVAVYEKLIDN